MDGQWRIELLGRLRVALEGRVATLLPAQKAGSLLAYLAYYRNRPQPREVLIDLLWPEGEPAAGRGNLRFVLHTLRRQLEPLAPDTEPSPGAILIADRNTIGLDPKAFTTDVAEFKAVLQGAGPGERIDFLTAAVELYRGELLPGFYEPWVLAERQRLAERYLEALHELVAALEQAGELERAVEYARRAVVADPLREETHYDLMRLYAAAGQPSATLRQYQELERLLREELGETPSAATRALAEELRQDARSVVVTRSSAARDQEATVLTEPKKQVLPEPASPPERPAAGDRAPGTGPWGSGAGAAPPLAATPSRLPVQFSRFFGREEEIARLAETLCIPETRLVTLTGPGGSGKTRLAIAVAGRLQTEFAGAVWFVPLAELTEARRLGDALRDALGLPPAGDGDPLEQAAAALRAGSALLVLDNFEQLVEEGAAPVRRLLERAPGLTCLITSRQRLELEGEQEFVVLPLPTPRRSEDLEQLPAYASVQLFLDRAQAARPGFRLTAENAPSVAALCDRLEGLPLALELAAARAGVLTPPQILTRLERRFELLVSPRRDVSGRHRSLRAAIEWSYQLLSPELQRFFRRLSVFRGGWTLEAAEAICSDVELPPPTYRWGGDLLQTAPPRVEDPAALEHLEQLRECSLVIAEEAASGGEMRYRLLESIREFAAEQLSPEGADSLARRHLYHSMPLAHAMRHKVTQEQTAEAEKQRLREMDREYENLRAALEWGLQHEPAAALWLAAAMAVYWFIHGYWAEALAFLPLAARYESAATMEMRAKALRYAGEMAEEVADYSRAEGWLNEAAALGRQMGEPETLALARVYEGRTEPDPAVDRHRQMGAAEYEAAALFNLGEIALARGDYDGARALFQRSLDLRRGLWSTLMIISPLAGLGDVALAQGDCETAHACYSESLTIARAGSRQRDAAQRLLDLGAVACHRGEYAQASEYVREGLEIFRDYGDKASIAATYRGMGDLALAQGKHTEARDCYRESLMILRQVGHRRSVAGVLEGFARLSHSDAAGDSEERAPGERSDAGGRRAALLLGAAQALRQAIGSPLPPNEQPALEALAAALQQSLGATGFSAAREAGRALSWEQAAAVALGES